MYSGFFALTTSQDLLRKLQHDYERIIRSPDDSFAAFDFFVTASCLIDWVHPHDYEARKEMLAEQPLLRVCRELANGSKHFSSLADAVKLGRAPKKALFDPAVQGTSVAGEAFDPAFDTDAFQSQDFLLIELDGTAAQTLGVLARVDDLAGDVLTYWKGVLGKRDLRQ